MSVRAVRVYIPGRRSTFMIDHHMKSRHWAKPHSQAGWPAESVLPCRASASGRYGRENILLDDGVYAPVSVDHLGDSEIDRDRHQRDRLVFGQLLRIHQELPHLPERVAH